MPKRDGRKLDHLTLESIRVHSVQRILAGEATSDQVAEELGFSRAAVFSWMKLYREQGWDALGARPIPGRPRAVSDEQARWVFQTLRSKTPGQLGFDFGLWTRKLVVRMLHDKFGLVVTEQLVGRMLRRMGLSPQRPKTRAVQRDQDAVTVWKEQTFQQIRAAAKQAGASVFFGDEAGIRSDYHSGTTWSSVGHTPVVPKTGQRFGVTMLSAVTAAGAFSFMLHDGRVDASVFIEFCRRLLADAAGPVYLIVDNVSYHKAKSVKQFVESTQGQLTIFYLPPYAPDTNPDEWVWKNLKHDNLGKATIINKHEMIERLTRAVDRLKNTPSIIQGFFRDPDLAYISA